MLTSFVCFCRYDIRFLYDVGQESVGINDARRKRTDAIFWNVAASDKGCGIEQHRAGLT